MSNQSLTYSAISCQALFAASEARKAELGGWNPEAGIQLT
jgi:hypothetical protein